MTEEEYMSEEEWDEWLSQGSPRNEDGDPILLDDPEDDPRIEDEKLREEELRKGEED